MGCVCLSQRFIILRCDGIGERGDADKAVTIAVYSLRTPRADDRVDKLPAMLILKDIEIHSQQHADYDSASDQHAKGMTAPLQWINPGTYHNARNDFGRSRRLIRGA